VRRYSRGGHEISRQQQTDTHFCARLLAHLAVHDRHTSKWWAVRERLSEQAALAGAVTQQVDESSATSARVSAHATIHVASGAQLVRCEVKLPTYAPRTLLDSLRSNSTSGAPFIRDAKAPSRATTYADLAAFVETGAGDLRSRGVNRGDVVSYAPPGGGALASVAFIAVAAQAIAAPLDPGISALEAASAFVQFNVRHVVLFEGNSADGLAAAAADTPTVRTHIARALGVDQPGLFEFIGIGQDRRASLTQPHRQASLTPMPPLTGPSDVVLLLRTSGTTSAPKGVPLRQEQLVSNGMLLAGALQLTSQDHCLNAMPLFHIGGISASLLGTLATGGQCTCITAFDPAHFIAALGGVGADEAGEEGPMPSWYSAVPTIHLAVLNHARAMASESSSAINDGVLFDRHALRFIRSGAAALTPQDARALSNAFGGLPVLSTYSMSELMPISQPPAGCSPHVHMFDKPGSVGVPIAASLTIVDQDSLVPQPPGTPGVIAVSGQSVMHSYLDDPVADAASFFLLSCASTGGNDSAFFLTGDVGVIDSEGHLVITGRTKELIKKGGEQVSPYEVEAALETCVVVRKAVVFSVPSVLWGEEVGAAIVLFPNAAKTPPRSPRSPSDIELKSMLSDSCHASGLAPTKFPTVVIVVSEDELPKTATRKYIRSGLAGKLGVTASITVDTTPRLGPPTVSKALTGVRYFLACQVIFNHIGSQKAHVEGNWGAVSNGRFFCIHVPAFFALGGFGLASSMSVAPPNKLSFAAARLSPMYPMYLLSLAPLLINLLLQCNPSTYDAEFHYTAQPDDTTRGDFCESSPMIRSWWGTLGATLLIYGAGVQAWPIYHASWFLSYYSWFSSVYYFLLACFPWLYTRALLLRGRRLSLLLLMAGCALANYGVVALYTIVYFRLAKQDDDGATNQFSLACYLFPPFWLPCFGMGIVSAFLFDAYRPYLGHGAWRWGVLCDVITFGLVAQAAATVMLPDEIRPDSVAPDDGLDVRSWAAIQSRMYGPLMVLWLYALAVDRGITARFFSRPLFVERLGPISYFMYLFHQLVGQYYWLVTRRKWWSYWRYRKAFFWFSPAPVPTAWWEYFFIVILTTWLAEFLALVDPWLIARWERARVYLFGGRLSEGSLTIDVVLKTISGLTGAPVNPDATLAECGLVSVAAPVIISLLTAALPGVTISLPDLVAINTVLELADLLEERRKEASTTGV